MMSTRLKWLLVLLAGAVMLYALVLVLVFLRQRSMLFFPSHDTPWTPLAEWTVEALEGYQGKVEIYGALHDRIIPIAHARRLAASLPQAELVELECGHNGWSQMLRMKLR